MKKLTFYSLILLMTVFFLLTSCGGGEGGDATDSADGSSESQSKTETDSDTEGLDPSIILALNGNDVKDYSIFPNDLAKSKITPTIKGINKEIFDRIGAELPMVDAPTGKDIIVRVSPSLDPRSAKAYFDGNDLIIEGGHYKAVREVVAKLRLMIKEEKEIGAGLDITEKIELSGYIEETIEKEDPISYKCGEEIKVVFSLKADGQVIGCPQFKYQITGDDGQKKEGYAESKDGTVTLTTSLSKPGFVRFVIRACDEKGDSIPQNEHFEGSFGADVDKIEAGLPEPADFDKFWKEQLKALDKIKPTVISKVEVDSGDPKYAAYDIKLKCVGDMPVSGVLTMPKNASKGSLEGRVEFQGYGYSSASVKCYANAIVFHVNTHGYENFKDSSYYRDFERTHPNYGFDKEQNKSPETCYFLNMLLRDLQGVKYVLGMPEYNGKGIILSGQSQAAMRSTAVAALMPDKVASLDIRIPWMSDVGGNLIRGLSTGFQQASADNMTLTYFDTSNFAKRVVCDVKMSMNMGDTTCPPATEMVLLHSLNNAKSLSLTMYQNCNHVTYGRINHQYTLKIK